jgi:hypothetical protein
MFTTMTQKQRAISIRQSYMNGIAKYTAVTFFLAAVGIVRQIFSSTISFLRRLFY